MKAVITHISGLIGLLFFEGFTRLIISFYHRIDFNFYGISHLPADIWIIIIFSTVFISTWLASMLVLTVLGNHHKRNTIIFAVLIVIWRAIEISNSYQVEPTWYFIVLIGLHLVAVWLAYIAYDLQKKSMLTD